MSRKTNINNEPESKKTVRDPAEVRAESFRTSAQRETVEAFVVAFILALLFRAFLAEAFVIPTGSMAPTLMGAHKDLTCDRCNAPFQLGASRERTGPVTQEVVVGGICPNCRHANSIDFLADRNHATFNGDRILVSKFAYMIAEPQRWDVIVFKFPGNPKQNYIKRLVGLPNETLTIRHGDVYQRPTGSDQRDEIVRKPPQTLLAMRHLVHDTQYQAPSLIQANYPSRWQPWTEGASAPPTDSWKVERAEATFVASLDQQASDRTHWLRYYHRWIDQDQWRRADRGLSLADIDPYSSRLITDFYAYGSYILTNASDLYQEPPATNRGSIVGRIFNSGYSSGQVHPRFDSGISLEQFRKDNGANSQDGLHWVGDLIVEADVETADDCKELILEIVEAGVQYQCQIDLSNGRALLKIKDDQDRFFDPHDNKPNQHPTAQTSVRAGGRHVIRMSNCDDELLLWVDDKVIQFDAPTTFDARLFRSDADSRPHFNADSHPLDAAPVGIGVRGGASTVRNLRIDRDKYYIATSMMSEEERYGGMSDYDMSKIRELTGQRFSYSDIRQLMTQPQRWAEVPVWQARRSITFELHEDQFFPMGDNSPESLDARCWAGSKVRFGMPDDAARWADAYYVPRDLLVGKALLVFWPHSWNSPVPFTPNFRRMKFIR